MIQTMNEKLKFVAYYSVWIVTAHITIPNGKYKTTLIAILLLIAFTRREMSKDE
jgi:hypothetical protein